jgi:secondary thiamine-phosphate synthase enzyme
MKIHNEYVTLHVRQPREFINITAQVKAAVAKSEIQEGLVLVSSLHVNSGIFVNDDEPGLLADIDECFERLAPHRDDYKHGAKFESNASAHLKSLLLHHQVALAITGGKIEFGPWQNVIFAEFDGGRPKRVLIKVLGI